MGGCASTPKGLKAEFGVPAPAPLPEEKKVEEEVKWKETDEDYKNINNKHRVKSLGSLLDGSEEIKEIHEESSEREAVIPGKKVEEKKEGEAKVEDEVGEKRQQIGNGQQSEISEIHEIREISEEKEGGGGKRKGI